jgi:riboflavin kinase / FMN adenylyltransferase
MNLPLIVTGIVEHGNGDGRKLGFPTANLRIHQPIELEHGVYAATCEINHEVYKSVLHYGPRLVFNETNPLFEVHILDFSRDIYEKEITVTLTNFIRGSIKFNSLDELIEQMIADKKKAYELLNVI